MHAEPTASAPLNVQEIHLSNGVVLTPGHQIAGWSNTKGFYMRDGCEPLRYLTLRELYDLGRAACTGFALEYRLMRFTDGADRPELLETGDDDPYPHLNLNQVLAKLTAIATAPKIKVVQTPFGSFTQPQHHLPYGRASSSGLPPRCFWTVRVSRAATPRQSVRQIHGRSTYTPCFKGQRSIARLALLLNAHKILFAAHAAKLLGLTRTSVSSLVGTLSKRGIVKAGGDPYRLIDRGMLRSYLRAEVWRNTPDLWLEVLLDHPELLLERRKDYVRLTRAAQPESSVALQEEGS